MILGLSFSHNASACVVDETDGNPVFCCSEERFTRRKNEWGIPHRSLEYIVRHVAAPRDITRVVLGESCRLHYGCREFARLMNLEDYAAKDAFIRSKARVLRLAATEALSRSFSSGVDLRSVVREQLRGLGIEAPVSFIEHHVAHASSAFYASPFDEALVITIDGEGDGLSGSCWHGRGNRMTLIDTIREEDSIGLFYKSITALLGFKVNQQEGKVMGLASSGDPERFYAVLRNYLSVSGDGETLHVTSRAARFHLDKLSRSRMHFLRLLATIPAVLSATRWEDLLNQLLKHEFTRLYRPLFECAENDGRGALAEDTAAAAQRLFEEAVLAVVRHFLRKAPSRNIALSGGVFANVRINEHILNLPGVDALYVCPAMGDEGLALGAAYAEAHRERETRAPRAALDHVFRGPAFTPSAVRSALSDTGLPWHAMETGALVDNAARALAGGAVVGLFHGALEYGPRALGHRSILANPALEYTRPSLNERLGRNDFMPFAPAVLEESYATLFNGSKHAASRLPARFMTITALVRPEWRGRIPAVVHVDGTARPQVLSSEDDPLFYAIVHRFAALTGIGCVLNTSFNLHDEPIVNTPEEALRIAMRGAVDSLVMENCVAEGFPIRRSPEPAKSARASLSLRSPSTSRTCNPSFQSCNRAWPPSA